MAGFLLLTLARGSVGERAAENPAHAAERGLTTTMVAKASIQLAKDGERDPERLRDGALRILGKSADRLAASATQHVSRFRCEADPHRRVD